MSSEEEVRLYQHYKEEGKTLAAEGDIRGAIRATQKANAIYASDRLERRIEKLKAFLKETENSDYSEHEVEEPIEVQDDADVEFGDGFHLSRNLYEQLYEYQKKGIEWLWGLHVKAKGGVLGDDMGLGKTIQVIGFLSSLIECKLIRSAVIIMPVSLITNWCNEFVKWAPNVTFSTFHSETKSQRERNLIKIQRGTGILITSYGMVVSNAHLFKTLRGKTFVWDYIILDEGHKIKNPTKTTKAVHEIPAKHRLVLTGTPVQNNLRELWALYDFCHQGTLLGSLQTFKAQYETIINRSREKNATSGERKLGNMMADSLRELIAPYFLRRTKQEVLLQQNQGGENLGPSGKPEKQMCRLPQKNDLIVWLHLSDIQIQIYDDFLRSDQVKSLLMTKKSPLVALTVLKKICDHPRLLSARACLQLGMNGEISQEELDEMLADEETTAPSIDVDHDVLLKESGKLSILLELLERLREEGHKTLVFSQSRKMLDIINNILLARDWKVMRLDGLVKKLSERDACVQQFQKGDIYSVMLLTTQVGGVGLTLTAADRVVIYDPSWNPATDAQAVDRAYRIGQKKPVVVYRLITCGTVEEKIYRRQIFKESITRKTTGASEDPHRYFTNMELRELFRLDNPKFSSTQRQLEELHSHQRLVYPELKLHLDYLRTLDIFGISDHDLMFQGQLDDSMEQEDHDQESIRSRVEKAQFLLQLESEQVHNQNLRSGTYCKELTNLQKPRVKSTTIGDSANVHRITFAAPVMSPQDSIVIESVDGDESLALEPTADVTLQDSIITVHDVSSAPIEELTEEELEDMKNISMTDPEFAKALEMSLQEYKARTAENNKTSRHSYSTSEDADAILTIDESRLERSIPRALSGNLNEPSTSHDEQLNLALRLSRIDFEGQEMRKKTQLTNRISEDLDLERAIRLSLEVSFVRSKEKDFDRSVELSQANLHNSDRASKESVESLPPRKDEILVVDSDYEDDFETSLPDLDQTHLGASTSRSFLDQTLFSPIKAPLSSRHGRKSQILGIPETDEDSSD